jgi:hypothetical protein
VNTSKRILPQKVVLSHHIDLGYPSDDPQIWELYWSPSQVRGRSHPNTLKAATWLNTQFFHTRTPDKIDFEQQLTYADRVRIRHPSDAKFALGPHVDGGGIERWEDPEYRQVFRQILTGHWEKFDSFDATHRVGANMELYSTPNACSAFRSWQGWLSLSETGPGEGTLKIFPFLKEATAYWVLRPFVRPTELGSDWELDTESPEFHGALPGFGQEMYPHFHPHLRLPDSLPSVPIMFPGDFVFWQSESIHAVEAVHNGDTDSAVMYVPVVPLCDMNVGYIKVQKEAFLKGTPPPDFPGGVGESQHIGKGEERMLIGVKGREVMGFEKFEGLSDSVRRANAILGL